MPKKKKHGSLPVSPESTLAQFLKLLETWETTFELTWKTLVFVILRHLTNHWTEILKQQRKNEKSQIRTKTCQS